MTQWVVEIRGTWVGINFEIVTPEAATECRELIKAGKRKEVMWESGLPPRTLMSTDEYCMPASWIPALEMFDPALLFMNHGMWYHISDHTDDWRHYARLAKTVHTYLENNWRGGLVIYRTSNVGHPACGNKREPVKLEDALAQIPVPEEDIYHWYRVRKVEMIWFELFANSKHRLAGKAFVADIYTLTLTRPDNHYPVVSDCLHKCVASEIEYWVLIIWNLFMQKSTNLFDNPAGLAK